MSQHSFTTNEGRKVLYGLDKPTGGYFFTEFYKDNEIEDDNEVKNSKDGLTLTELSVIFAEQYNALLNMKFLALDWDKDQDPAPMQYQVNKMFSKDLTAMLQRVNADITENYL